MKKIHKEQEIHNLICNLFGVNKIDDDIVDIEYTHKAPMAYKIIRDFFEAKDENSRL